MMPSTSIIAAILLQMALTLIVYWVLGVRRIDALKTGAVNIPDINVVKDKYPESAKLAEYAVSNQSELPVLFYIGSGVALFLGVWWLDVVLAGLFVVSRYAHAFVHLTSNLQPHRFVLFSSGCFIIVAWVAVLAIRLIGIVAN